MEADATEEHAGTTTRGVEPRGPNAANLAAFKSITRCFAGPDFVAGAWSEPVQFEDGALQMPYWTPSETVAAWERALYEHHIIDADSGYLDDDNVEFVARALEDPSLVADLDLPTLRRVLTFLARAERHSGGGWYEQAFESGMAQAATRRLGELAAG